MKLSVFHSGLLLFFIAGLTYVPGLWAIDRQISDSQYVEYQLQWKVMSPFLNKWIRMKQGAGSAIKKIVNAHNKLSKNDLEISLERNTESRIKIQNSLSIAIQAIDDKKYLFAKNILSKIDADMTPDEMNVNILLESIIAGNENNTVQAELMLQKINPESNMYPLARLNLALLNIQRGSYKQSLSIISELQDVSQYVKLSKQAKDYLVLIQALALGLSGKIIKAKKLVSRFSKNHPLYSQSLVIKAEIFLKNRKYESALLPLMQLENIQKNTEVITYSRIKIIESLTGLQNNRQVLELREGYISEMLRLLRKKYQIATKLTSSVFLKSLMARYSGSKKSLLIHRLNWNSSQLLDEIERNNTLRNMLIRSYKDIITYNSILKKGRKYWSKNLLKYNKRKVKKSPKHSAKLNIDLLEKLLTELVGVPESEEIRYQLLDGLSIWVKDRTFKERWWIKKKNIANDNRSDNKRSVSENIKVNLAGAQKTLKYLLNIPRKKRRSLLDAHMKVLVKQMKKMPIKVKKLLAKLKVQKKRLRQELKLSLVNEANSLLLRVENELLWLVKQNLPVKNSLKTNNKQYRYYIKEVNDKSGLKHERIVKSGLTVSATNLKQTMKALNMLSSKARSKIVKYKAMFILANIHVDIVQKAVIDGAKNPYPVKGSLSTAVRLYRKLLSNSGAELSRSNILYQLARAYDLSGDLGNSLKYLNYLSNEYPRHALIEEINFRRAEIYFSFSEYNKASMIYSSLITDEASAYFEKSIYKLGWSYFKLAKYKQAIDEFYVLIERNWKNDERESSRFLDDVFSVTAMAFSNLNGVTSVEKYFSKEKDKKYRQVVLLQLAEYYQKKSRYSDAANTFAAIIKLYPADTRLYYYQSQIIKSYASGGFNAKVWQSRKEYIEKFGGDSDYWKTADKNLKNKIRRYLKVYLKKMAQRDHAKAQSHGNRQDYINAIGWYKKYVRDLSSEKETPEMYYLMAQAYHKIGQYQAAIDAYQKAAYEYPDYSKRENAAYSVLSVYQSKYQKGKGIDKAKILQKEIELSQKYLDRFGNGVNGALVRTKMAEDYLLLDKPELAIQQSKKLINDKSPLTKSLYVANWRVIARASFLQKNYIQAEKAYRSLLKLKIAPKERKISTQHLAESLYKQAEKEQKQGNMVQAINRYASIARLDTNTDIHARAEFEIATIQIILKQWKKAIVTLEKFIRKFPEHSLKKLIAEKLVIAYENSNNWVQAARYLKQIYDREGGSPLGRDALWRSAALYQKSKEFRKSYEYFKKFIRVFPRPLEDALEAREQLVIISDKLGDSKKNKFWLNEIIRMHDAGQSAKTDRTLFLASKSSLTLAIKNKKIFDRVLINLPLDKSLRKKQKIMRTTLKYLNKTISYQLADHSTQATLLVADIYRSMARDLMDSPRPKNLNNIELAQYEILLEDQVFPFEDKAIDFYELNMSQIKNGIYTPWIKKSLIALQQLMPSRYLKQEKMVSYYEAIQ